MRRRSVWLGISTSAEESKHCPVIDSLSGEHEGFQISGRLRRFASGHRRYRREVCREPVSRQLGRRLEGAGFFEEMRGTGNDSKFALAPKSGPGVFVEIQYNPVVTTDDEQCRGAHRSKMVTRQVGPTASGDDGGHGRTGIGRGAQCGGRARTGAEVCDG